MLRRTSPIRHRSKPSRRSAPRHAVAVAVTLLAAGYGIARQPSAMAQQPMPGQTLAFDRSKGNCLTCHDIKGGEAPGNVGPPLADMKTRFPLRKDLTAIVFDETQRNQQTMMPPFGRNLILTQQEIEFVVDFLYTR